MKKEQLDEIETRAEKLTRIEIEYFRDWLMNHYDILGMTHDIFTIVETMDDVGAEYEEINNFLNNIRDHSKWEIEESIYIEEEKNGEYRSIELEIELDKLNKIEFAYFADLLKIMYPIYKHVPDYFEIIETMDTDKGAKYEELMGLLKDIKDHSKWKIDESIYLKQEHEGKTWKK